MGETGTRLRRLNINLLYALHAVLEAPTLTAAARSVALSQPAMSAKLRQLRDHFGDELVIYGDRKLRTALGEALCARTGRLLREVDDTFNLTLDFDPATARQTITIAAPEAIELMFLSRVIPNMRARAPGLRIRTVPFVHGSVHRLFDAGVDMAIVPDAMVDPDLSSQSLFSHRLTGMVWREHPFTALSMDEADYLAAQHGAASEEIEGAMFGAYGPEHVLARRDVVIRTGLYSMLPLLALGSELIVTASDWFAQYNAAILPLRLVTLPFLNASSELVAQWQPYRAREPVIAWLIDALMRGARAIGAPHPQIG
ncbi:LysR family transcriptional regulator [Sphingomonas sp. TDK1]|uniref:LysR family transcriptional regulator n=1 Tax=Sphingomonas sp. TDK1 TaxID=453247 RepID=UPI0007D8E495|nr:LysR family transcriptional regulator [Sphingomonas sp. TDK1]OAN63902.1 hypothetical protein A7X12_19060 [Sphingomonas sp. TDK1]